MANKTVLLPREWNDPWVPPDSYVPVMVKLYDGQEAVAIWNGVSWLPSLSIQATRHDPDEVKLSSGVRGWATILQQQ